METSVLTSFVQTGTLTEDGLDMWGVVPIEDHRIEKPIKDINTMAKDSLLFQGMLTCHSLTLIDNELCGDPLDIKVSKIYFLIFSHSRPVKNLSQIASFARHKCK